jgi:hypothetical protein
MNYRLTAIEDRLIRADENLEELKRIIREHFASGAFNLTGEFDPNGERGIRLSGFVLPPPLRVFTIVGDILHELRSSLDWLVWQLVEENGAGEPGDNTGWPVLSVRPTAYKKGPTRGKHPPPYIEGGVSDVALAVIDDAQPYQWEEAYAAHPLYVLHWLNIRDKHRHIAIRGASIRETKVYGDDPLPKFTWTAQLIETTEDGALIRLVPDDPKVDVHTEAEIQVMLHEDPGGPHSPLLQTLTQIREAVWTAFLQLEREFPPDGPTFRRPDE